MRAVLSKDLSPREENRKIKYYSGSTWFVVFAVSGRLRRIGGLRLDLSLRIGSEEQIPEHRLILIDGHSNLSCELLPVHLLPEAGLRGENRQAARARVEKSKRVIINRDEG